MRCVAEWAAILALSVTLIVPAVTGCSVIKSVIANVDGNYFVSVVEGSNITITGTIEYCDGVTDYAHSPIWHIQTSVKPKFKEISYVEWAQEQLKTLKTIPKFEAELDKPSKVRHFNLTLINVELRFKFIVLRGGVHLGHNNETMAKSVVLVEIVPQEARASIAHTSTNPETPTHANGTLSTVTSMPTTSETPPTSHSDSSSPPEPKESFGQLTQTTTDPGIQPDGKQEGLGSTSSYILIGIACGVAAGITTVLVGIIVLVVRRRKNCHRDDDDDDEDTSVPRSSNGQGSQAPSGSHISVQNPTSLLSQQEDSDVLTNPMTNHGCGLTESLDGEKDIASSQEVLQENTS